MSLPAKKVTESAEALRAAIAPTTRFDEEELRGALDALRDFASLDPRRAFGHTVREHRAALDSLDPVLRDMSIYGGVMEHEAAVFGFGAIFSQALSEACLRLRVVRTLAAILSGDRKAHANEEASVQAVVRSLFEERGRAVAGEWDEGERKAYSTREPRASAEFEAWLNEG